LIQRLDIGILDKESRALPDREMPVSRGGPNSDTGGEFVSFLGERRKVLRKGSQLG